MLLLQYSIIFFVAALIPHSSAEISEGCKADVVFVVDSSGSVEDVFNLYKKAGLDFTRDLSFGRSATQFALVQYSRNSMVKYSFADTQTADAVTKAISNLEYLGDTTLTADAVKLGLAQFASGRPEASKVFVLMTDGNSFDEWQKVKATAEAVAQSGAKVYVVALGDSVYEPEIQLYAGKGTVVRKNDLPQFKSDLRTMTCSTGTAAPLTEPVTTAGPLTGGTTTPKATTTEEDCEEETTAAPVTTERPVTTVSQGPVTTTQARGCPSKVDLVFVIDSSGSVEDVFQKYKDTALEFLDQLTFGSDAVQVAVVQYSKKPPFVKYAFSQPQTYEAITTAIADLPFLGDTTLTAAGVHLGLDQYSSGRSDALKVFVLMTDGNSFDSWAEVKEASGAVVKSGAKNFVIALGDTVYDPEVELYSQNGVLVRKTDLPHFKANLNSLSGNCPVPVGRSLKLKAVRASNSTMRHL